MATNAMEAKIGIDASPDQVFKFLTRPAELREWFCDRVILSAREGGAFHFDWNSGWWARGVFEKVTPPKSLAFTWFGPGEPEESKVEILLTPAGKGTKVTLKHTGVGAGGKWKSARAEIEKGWTDSLENLKSIIETGIDLRVARRPVMGVGLEPVTPELAKKEGLPVKDGVRIFTVDEKLGAAKAGIKKGDILVSVGGKATPTYEAVITAMGKHRAGETVILGVYREGKKQEVPVTLGARPIPELPATHEEAVAALKKSREEIAVELDKLVEGANEAQAEKKPAPEKWCAKEALAHLIVTEMVERTGILGSFAGDVLDGNDNITVYPEALKAVLAGAPDLRSLSGRLRNEYFETLALFEALRPEFQRHRARYRRIYTEINYLSEHARHHYKQFSLAMQGRTMS